MSVEQHEHEDCESQNIVALFLKANEEAADTAALVDDSGRRLN
jgi:hypothetical protein